MVDHGSRIATAPVEGWWDAGKPETLIETNDHLLRVGRGGIDADASVEGCEVVEPVRFEAGVVVRGGRVGPNVTLEAGTAVTDCELSYAVVGPNAILERSRIHDSIIGAEARISDASGVLLVTDHSVVAGERG
jgi:glucose-1-phosphate thymidylyltransferase